MHSRTSICVHSCVLYPMAHTGPGRAVPLIMVAQVYVEAGFA